MNYSMSLEIIMSLAGSEAVAGRFREIEPEHLLMAVLKFSEMDPEPLQKAFAAMLDLDLLREELGQVRALLQSRKIESVAFRRALRISLGKGGGPPPGGNLHRSQAARLLFDGAKEIALTSGTRLVAPVHLLQAILANPTPAVSALLPAPEPRAQPAAPPPEVEAAEAQPPDVAELTRILKELRSRLLGKVFGQDHAVQAFVEGLFSAEIAAAADVDRRKPKALFVFAGPPGVGKTYLAECGAQSLGRPFRRFDMSGYSDQMGAALLAGAQRSYQAAGPGQLTEFVKQNPECVLLFDEIEKAHINVIHLFLQILDLGSLEDKFTQERVELKNSIVIFTTNAGKSLYENPNSTGVNVSSASFHRRTILNALEKELDPRTRAPFFPQAICSRMATGFPLMFNRLGASDLERIARAELERVGGLLEKQYGRKTVFGQATPLCLVMKEGARTDARTVRSQAEIFIKSEIFKFCSLNAPERLRDLFARAKRIVFDLDESEEMDEEVRALLEPAGKPKVLLAARKLAGALWPQSMPEAEWTVAMDLPDAENLLGTRDFDLALLDPWFGASSADGGGRGVPKDERPMTAFQFDQAPAAARSFQYGRELLRILHEKYPELPCYLLSSPTGGLVPKVGEELLLACIRSGGARGLMELCVANPEIASDPGYRDFQERLSETARRIHRERRAAELGSQSKVLTFDTAPDVSAQGDIVIRLRNLRIVQTLAAEDVSEVLSDVERPSTRFADVYGASQAKLELEYIVDWLRDPRRFKDLGLRPPRGILLYGDPGTGKTMLARALAGECNVTFMVESATNFVTKWVGSGPENVRSLFARARRYAPTVLFIDEIDAVGKKRQGEASGRAQEETLNAILTEMDGFGAPASKPVIVLAATNLAQHLDEALKRRFDREIEVDKPDKASRLAFLRKRLQGSPTRRVSDAVVERIAGQSANRTIADLERIVQMAGREASRRDGVITDEIMENAFETMRMGEAKGETDPGTLLRVARHEAGHCLIGWFRGEKPVQVTIVARGAAGGYVEREANEERMIYTRGELEGMIRQAMGGRAAEMVCYGMEEGLSTGVASDLENATRWAYRMVKEFGMRPEIGQLAFDTRRIHDGPLAMRLARAAEKIVKTQLDRAVEELEKNRDSLDLLTAALLDRNRLTRQDLEAILPATDSKGPNQ